MYMAQSRFGTARKQYQNVDLSSRIEGASPHGLVAIMFDELLKSIDAMAAACRLRDFGKRGTSQARALSILHGLESSLDVKDGGDIAGSLQLLYAHARDLLLNAGRSNDDAQVARARNMLGEIASAWRSIG